VGYHFTYSFISFAASVPLAGRITRCATSPLELCRPYFPACVQSSFSTRKSSVTGWRTFIRALQGYKGSTQLQGRKFFSHLLKFFIDGTHLLQKFHNGIRPLIGLGIYRQNRISRNAELSAQGTLSSSLWIDRLAIINRWEKAAHPS